MNKYLYGIIGVLFLAGVVWLIMTPGKPSKYDEFAQCIKDKKTVTFFGAFWCPHCQAEKARFGTSAKYLPYVECSTPDGQHQTQVCIDNGIVTYPTWQFATGTTPEATSTYRVVGEMELVDLAKATQCALPQ
jgi:thiol-disulfide isomerase/thioredoxin